MHLLLSLKVAVNGWLDTMFTVEHATLAQEKPRNAPACTPLYLAVGEKRINFTLNVFRSISLTVFTKVENGDPNIDGQTVYLRSLDNQPNVIIS